MSVQILSRVAEGVTPLKEDDPLAGLNPEAVPDVVAALKQCERELLQMRIEDAARWTPDYKKQLEHAESGVTIIKARAALAKLEQV